MKKVVEMTRCVRDQINIPIKKPIFNAVLVNSNSDFAEAVEIFGNYIKEEINAWSLEVDTDEDKYVTYSCDYDGKKLGQRLKKQFSKALMTKISTLSSEDIKKYMAESKLAIDGVEIIEGDLYPTKNLKEEYKTNATYAGIISGSYCVLINKIPNEDIERSYYSREFFGRIQKIRNICIPI